MRVKNNRILILGASGMLGNTLLRYFSSVSEWDVYGTVRSDRYKNIFSNNLGNKIISDVDVLSTDRLLSIFGEVKPAIVINCIGVVKQLKAAEDPLLTLPINSLLPHKLSNLCELTGARLIHFSTDCVFSGSKGMYIEGDIADADDLYGRSKFLGEVGGKNAITLRTSIIGHELEGSRSLVDWFLAQKNKVHGYEGAIFSGLPTIEIAKILHERVIPNNGLRGLYHLSVDPISKFKLLNLIATQYGKVIEIIAEDQYRVDRSLDSAKFRQETGFTPKPWAQLIKEMHAFK